ncbi:MAG: DUF2400 family protein [Candidatus Aenigmatarchaeota archaeon]
MNLKNSYMVHILDEAYDRLKNEYLSTSVLGPVRIYAAKNDIDKEFWTLFCALIDFQMSVKNILNPMLTGLVAWMEENGLKFIELIYDPMLAKKVFNVFQWKSSKGVKIGFTHRFVKVENIISLFQVFKKILENYSSLGTLIKEAYNNSLNREEPMEYVLTNLIRVLINYGGAPRLVPKKLASPLKRLNLFMRWMVRPYPDLGLWNFIDKKYLLVSLDEGLCRIFERAFSIKIELNWKGVLKATHFLRKINSDDPVKYDYLLSRLSIMGYCTKDLARSKCYLCPLVNICVSSRLSIKPKAKALPGKEYEIFRKYQEVYGHEFDSIITGYPLGEYTADAVMHKHSCEEYVVEVENKLNYNAIGQVITYRFLYFKIRNKLAKPMIICSTAPKELKEACEIEQGIKVVEISIK